MENKNVEQIKYEELELLIKQLENEIKNIKNNIILKEKILQELIDSINNNTQN